MSSIQSFFTDWSDVIGKAIMETFQMVGISLLFSILIGIPLGLLIVLTRPGQSFENKFFYQFLIYSSILFALFHLSFYYSSSYLLPS